MTGRGHRPPHFKADPYAASTTGNWTQEKTLQHVKNFPNLATHAYKIDQIYPGGSHQYLQKGKLALSSSSFRKGNHQLMRKMGVPEFVMNASSNLFPLMSVMMLGRPARRPSTCSTLRSTSPTAIFSTRLPTT